MLYKLASLRTVYFIRPECFQHPIFCKYCNPQGLFIASGVTAALAVLLWKGRVEFWQLSPSPVPTMSEPQKLLSWKTLNVFKQTTSLDQRKREKVSSIHALGFCFFYMTCLLNWIIPMDRRLCCSVFPEVVPICISYACCEMNIAFCVLNSANTTCHFYLSKIWIIRSQCPEDFRNAYICFIISVFIFFLHMNTLNKY